MTKAVLIIDFINEIVHEKGKLAKKGYADFINQNSTFDNLNKLINYSRKNNFLLIFVKVCFSSNYIEQPKNSPIFEKVKEFQILQNGTWATKFHESLNIKEDDNIIIKHRISAFYATQLETLLKANNITEILVADVSTDLAVSNTVREGHDKDYIMTIIEDCCAAANQEEHINSLKLLQKISKIVKIDELK